jgi:glycosyltransferase involved in cell wall biosynthesis
MDVFNLTDDEQKRNSRQRLGIQNGVLVISYLGSIGTWYMLDEMLLFFKEVKASFPSAKFLFITQAFHSVVDQKIRELELDKNDFIITSAARREVPLIAKASDINVSFIKPVYSKISSSPTKLGEVLSMGIPVICNGGVGDVESTVKKADAGFVLKGFTAKDFEAAITAIQSLLKKSPAAIRDAIKDTYSLENGIRLYLSCYRQILE